MNKIDIKPWNYDTMLTRSFSIGQLVCDPMAYQYKILEQYIEREHILQNLEFFCRSFLQPLQDAFPYPIVVLSGYRCQQTNRMRGGGCNSLHLIGFAADIVSYGHLPYLIETVKQMEFHQLKIRPGYIHVSKKEFWNECREYR